MLEIGLLPAELRSIKINAQQYSSAYLVRCLIGPYLGWYLSHLSRLYHFCVRHRYKKEKCVLHCKYVRCPHTTDTIVFTILSAIKQARSHLFITSTDWQCTSAEE